MKTSMTEVLAWLAEHHPDLHESVEQDRDWLWITADLRGDGNKSIRDSINHEGGFRFAKRGHSLPSGKIAYWGHSCLHPIGFKRKAQGTAPKGKRSNSGRPQGPQGRRGRMDPLAASPQAEDTLEDLAAAFV